MLCFLCIFYLKKCQTGDCWHLLREETIRLSSCSSWRRWLRESEQWSGWWRSSRGLQLRLQHPCWFQIALRIELSSQAKRRTPIRWRLSKSPPRSCKISSYLILPFSNDYYIFFLTKCKRFLHYFLIMCKSNFFIN